HHARLPEAVLRRLLEQHPDPRIALEAARHGGLAGRLRGECLAALRRPDTARLASDLDWLSRPGHRLLGWQDPDYPPLLRRSPNPPAMIFLAGDACLPWHAQIAVVGSRRPSAGGRARARRFAEAFASSSWEAMPRTPRHGYGADRTRRLCSSWPAQPACPGMPRSPWSAAAVPAPAAGPGHAASPRPSPAPAGWSPAAWPRAWTPPPTRAPWHSAAPWPWSAPAWTWPIRPGTPG